MHFDAITLACLTHELQQTIQTGRIQQLLMPDDLSIGLEIYGNQQRRYLLLSADPAVGRLYFSGQKLRRGTDAQPPLLLRMRKLARGAIIDKVIQPDPAERILHIGLDHPTHGVATLVVELIGRQSNLLLVGPDGKILECMRRFRPPKEQKSKENPSTQRTLLPGRLYETPPPMSQLHPLAEDLRSRLGMLIQQSDPTQKVRLLLVQGLNGVSPTLAREMVWRATHHAGGNSGGNAEARINETNAATLADALTDAVVALWSSVKSGDWRPGVVFEDGQVVGFAAYELHFRGEFVPTDSLSEALEQFYGAKQAGSKQASSTQAGLKEVTPTQQSQQPERAAGDRLAKNPQQQAQAQTSPQPVNQAGEQPPDPYAALRRTVADQIRSAHLRVDRQLKALAGDEPKAGEPEELRVKAEWLLALNNQIEDDQAELVVELGDQTLTIALNPKKTPVEQAEQMFDRAAKLERAAIFIPQRRQTLQADKAFITQLESDLLLAENQPELVAVQEELRNAGYLSQSQKKAQKAAPSASKARRYVSPDGLAILVGRNARQNDQVTFSVAGAADLWLHVRDAPGSHVVIRSGGQPVKEETLVMAAQLAAFYSSQKGERAVPVAYTEKRFVTRVPRGRPGQVYIRNEDTIMVAGDLPEDAMEST